MSNFKWNKNQKGAISILFIISLFSIFTIIAVSLNTAYFTIQNTRLQQAVESSIVAIGLSGKDLSLAESNKIVESQFATFFPSRYKDIVFNLIPPTLTKDSYTLDAQLKSAFHLNQWLSFVDVDTNTDLEIQSKVGVDVVQGNIEVALVMDNSGSMFQDIDTLKTSAKLFIDQLIDNRIHDEQVYISIVPFSDSVNIGPKNLSWIQDSLPPSAQQVGACINYRYPTTPAQAIIVNATLPPLPTPNSAGANKKFPGYSAGAFSACSEAPLLGLSNDKSELVKKINSMVASGFTDGDQGILWGWRTLAEEWQGLWKTEISRPLSTKEVKKVVIFFSDGASISNEANIFLPTCSAIKNKDIEIYTVQFSASNNSMVACASSQKHYFYANNQQQLKQAFIDISKNVGFELKLNKL